jgi:hypothetical protein
METERENERKRTAAGTEIANYRRRERLLDTETDSYRLSLGLRLFVGLRLSLILHQQIFIPSKRFGGTLHFLCVLQSACVCVRENMRVCVLQSESMEQR